MATSSTVQMRTLVRWTDNHSPMELAAVEVDEDGEDNCLDEVA